MLTSLFVGRPINHMVFPNLSLLSCLMGQRPVLSVVAYLEELVYTNNGLRVKGAMLVTIILIDVVVIIFKYFFLFT